MLSPPPHFPPLLSLPRVKWQFQSLPSLLPSNQFRVRVSLPPPTMQGGRERGENVSKRYPIPTKRGREGTGTVCRGIGERGPSSTQKDWGAGGKLCIPCLQTQFFSYPAWREKNLFLPLNHTCENTNCSSLKFKKST